jgi:hypothetical protein
MGKPILTRIYLVRRETIAIIVAIFMERFEDDFIFNCLHVATAIVL